MNANQTAAQPVMPDFSRPSAAFRHSVDSALKILSKLAVPLSRITVKCAGPGLPFRWIVAQHPAPGEPITPDEVVTLTVSDLGFFHNLPAGMRDKGTESDPGTGELLDFVDDPLQKAGHWIREGATLFNITEEDPAACSRWIGVFGLNAGDWAAEQWPRLARLLPVLQSLAGTEEGMRFALKLLLGLPLERIDTCPGIRLLRSNERTRLGVRASRLAVDCISGVHREDLSDLVLVIGPVKLDTYCEFNSREGMAKLKQLLDLLTPCFRKYRIRWLVEDATRAPRLGRREDNSILGVNSALGCE